MAKISRLIGQVAGVVAAVTAFIPGAQGISAIAGAVSAVANIASQALAKPPAAKGQVNERIIGANNPTPWMMGRTYSGGIQLYDVGYGGTVSSVVNPYRFLPVAYSLGPISEIESVQFDYAAVSFSGNAATGYYSGFLYRDAQLGALPESDALAAQWGGVPDWGSDYKLSGIAAVGYSLKFDKKAKIYANGDPIIGIIAKQKVYDPRLDSTRAGGSGAHRVDDPATWAFSENPALYAGLYAHGIYQNGVKIFGVDLGEGSVDWASVMAWANLCDVNGWKVGGTIYEPADKWNNLKRIAQAGGGQPVWAGGILTFRWHAERVSLDDISAADLAGGPMSAGSNKAWTERKNTLSPLFRSEAHQWNYIQAAPVTVPDFITEDGEEKTDNPQYDLVQDADQAAELAMYQIYDAREAGPFILTVKPRLIGYRPGDALTIRADCKLWPTDQLAIITKRTRIVGTGSIELELVSENSDKHAAALGEVAVIPAPPPFTSGADLDPVFGENILPPGYTQGLIINSYPSGVGGSILSAVDAGTDATITVAAHSRVYADKTISIPLANITGLDFSTGYYVYYDDDDRLDGAKTFVALDPLIDPAADAFNSPTNPFRHNVGYVTTPADGGGSTGGSGGYGGGGGYGGPIP